MEIGQVRADGVLNHRFEDGVALRALHSLDPFGEPRRDVEHLAAGFGLAVDQRVDRAWALRFVGRGQGRCFSDDAHVGMSAKALIGGIEIRPVNDIEPVDPRLHVVGKRLVRPDPVDKAGLASARSGQFDRPQDAASVDMIGVNQVDVPRQPLNKQLAVDLVDLTFGAVVDQLEQFRMAVGLIPGHRVVFQLAEHAAQAKMKLLAALKPAEYDHPAIAP